MHRSERFYLWRSLLSTNISGVVPLKMDSMQAITSDVKSTVKNGRPADSFDSFANTGVTVD